MGIIRMMVIHARSLRPAGRHGSLAPLILPDPLASTFRETRGRHHMQLSATSA